MANKKAQGLIPSTLVGWILAVAAFILFIFIIYTYRDSISSMLGKAFDIFNFGV